MRFSYFARLQGDTQRWVNKGLIDQITAEALLSESKSQKTAYSFSSIVIVLGVICLCFAAMTFVAANWEEMPRLFRVILLIACMWGAYGGAVYAQGRSYATISDALVLLGCGIFGAAIMLVGQMYHLQGRAQDAVLLWACGTVVAVALLRSTGALWLAIALFLLWFWFDVQPNLGNGKAQINLYYPITWLLCALLAWWLSSRRSAHLLAIGFLAWIAITVAILTERHETLTYVAMIYCLTFLAVGAVILSSEQKPVLKGFEGSIIQYLVFCLVCLTSIWVIAVSFNSNDRKLLDIIDTITYLPLVSCFIAAAALTAFGVMKRSLQVYDLAFCTFWIGVTIILISPIGRAVPFLAEAYALGLSIWLIRMGARQELPYVTRTGYAAFAVVMLLIYFRTAGTLLGTSGFYLTAGLLLVLGAIFLPRFFRTKSTKEASS